MSNQRGNVPFAWEDKPGVSKAISRSDHEEFLPPPPPSIKERSMSDQRGNVPFAWENMPGASKAISRSDQEESLPPPPPSIKERRQFPTKLPPPPCPMTDGSRVSMAREMQIPLPPGTFQRPQRCSSKKGAKKQDDDPFLAAYKECTKSTKAGHRHKLSNQDAGGLGFGLRKHMLSNFSCKRSCSVRDDNLVRVSHFECERER